MPNSILRVFPDRKNPQRGQIQWREKTYNCTLGKHGVVSDADKQEGDQCTPAGLFPFRWLYYRPDRIERPATLIETRPLAPNDGWCDEPKDENYNCPVALPYKAKVEALWREDHCYDLLAVIGHNDQPAIANGGSAIFIHVARDGMLPTRGCVALSRDDFIEVFETISPNSIVRIHLPQEV
jgi:L,D-peptidoglycan transpeptidase YkuD (ErfK/YbiS/YcfS/YnhG family)